MQGVTAQPEDPNPRYGVFLSYRHDPRDRRWARWVHRALETWRTPRRLVDSGVPARVGRVFRDEEELGASPHLTDAIEMSLREARFLLVVCSPRTPASDWVGREVERFREMGRGDRILALLVEGEPHESFPAGLHEHLEAPRPDGLAVPVEEEPLAADVRPLAGERPRLRRRLALLRLLAPILGCRFDDLRRREQERRTRRLAIAGLAATLLAGVMGALAAYALHQEGVAVRERAEAVVQRGRAEERREEAVAARKEEEAARNRSEELTEYMLFELRDQLEPVGRTALLRGVAQRVVAYYESRDPASTMPDERRRFGAALVNLGLAYEDDGHLEEALALHRRALAIHRPLHTGSPQNLLFLSDVAVGELRVAVCLESMGRLSEAERGYRTALAVRRTLLAAEPEVPGRRLNVAFVLRNLGDVLDSLGRRTEAMAAYREGHALVTDVESGRAGEVDRAASERRLAGMLAESDLAEALRLCRSSLATYLRLLEAAPQDRLLRREVLRSRSQLASLLGQEGVAEASLAELERVVAGARTWREEDPHDVWAGAALVEGQIQAAGLRMLRGEFTLADGLLAEAVGRARALVTAEPARTEFAKALGVGLASWTMVRSFLGDAGGAAAAAKEALELFDRLPEQDASLRSTRIFVQSIEVQSRIGPEGPSVAELEGLSSAIAGLGTSSIGVPSQFASFMRGFGWMVIATAHSVAGRPSDAVRVSEAALPELEGLRSADPAFLFWRYLAAMHHALAGQGRLDLGDPAAALPHLGAAILRAQAGAGEQPTMLDCLLANTQLLRARAQVALHQPEAALEAVRASRARLEALEQVAFLPAQTAAATERACDLEAELLVARKDLPGALVAYRGSLAASQRYADLSPADRDARIDVAVSHVAIGGVLRDLGRLGEALAAYRAATATLDPVLQAGGGDAKDWERSALWHEAATDLAERTGDPAAAIGELRAAFDISRTRARGAPVDPTWVERAGRECERLGGLLLSGEDAHGALDALHAGVGVLESHVAGSSALRQVLGSIERRIRAAEDTARAQDLLDERVGPVGPVDHRRMAALLYARKRYRGALGEYEKVLAEPLLRADLAHFDLYNAACCAALGAAEGGEGGDALQARALQLLEEDLRLRRERLAQVESALTSSPDAVRRAALDAERRALLGHLLHGRERDPDLQSLRALPAFQALFESTVGK